MNRITALEQALAIVEKAKVSVAVTNKAAWHFLYNVAEHIQEQQHVAFNATFRA